MLGAYGFKKDLYCPIWRKVDFEATGDYYIQHKVEYIVQPDRLLKGLMILTLNCSFTEYLSDALSWADGDEDTDIEEGVQPNLDVIAEMLADGVIRVMSKTEYHEAFMKDYRKAM